MEACRRITRVVVDNGAPLAARCSACGADLTDHGGDAWRREGRVESCPACGCRELFIRKDFPQRLGLAIVVVAGFVAFVLLQRHTLAAAGVLLGVVLLDAALYLLVGRATVCYRCRAVFRGVVYNPAHSWFDLATAEKYPRT
jgi:hypothetical protein